MFLHYSRRKLTAQSLPPVSCRAWWNSIVNWLAVGVMLVGSLGLVKSASAAQLSLQWDWTSSGASASFKVERKTGTAGTYALITPTPVVPTTFVDSTVTAGTTYCYRVQAVNSTSTSGYSNEACASAPAETTSSLSLTVAKAGAGSGTVVSQPAGINCGSDCSETYTTGSVTLSATPSTGSTFSSWTGGGCSGTGSCVVTGGSSVQVTANFALASSTPPSSPPSGSTSGAEIIIDNAAVGIQGGGRSFTGTWCVSGAPNPYGADSLYSCGGGLDTYRWTPTIATPGTYDVYVRWTAHSSRSTVVPITVTHAGGTTTSDFNQQSGGGAWMRHGNTSYKFNAGTDGYVQVADSKGQAGADAVRLVLQPVASGSAATYSLWSSSTTPALVTDPDSAPIEVGVKFVPGQAGYVTGIRFYKGPQNLGTHVGSLWTSTGTRLATATFTNETASGWQQVNFATPVAVTKGTTYVASYFAPQGKYSVNENYFNSAYTNGPLTALATGTGGNGLYRYTATSAFPNATYNATNYWVDVVFK